MGSMLRARRRRAVGTICAAVALVALAPAAASAATLTVSDLTDHYNLAGCDATTGVGCSLREAISAATAGDTIELVEGTYVLAPASGPLRGTDNSNAQGDLDVLKSLDIVGAGADKTIIDQQSDFGLGAVPDGVFHILGGATLTVSGVMVKGGNRGSGSNGGGFNVGGGDPDPAPEQLVLVDSIVRENGAGRGGGILIDSGSGGSIIRSTITQNNAVHPDNRFGGGAGIANSGVLMLQQVTIFDNNTTRADARGAGILNLDPAGSAKGVLLGENVTISSNRVRFAGVETGQGGGLWTAGDVQLISSTIADNRALVGNGVYVDGGDVNLTNTLLHNEATNNCAFKATTMIITSNGGNLDRGTTCRLSGDTDLINADPRLADLVTAGTVMTYPLRRRSAAVDRGVGTCPAVDGRSVPRGTPNAGPCDIGAHETDRTDLAISAFSGTPDPVQEGQAVTYSGTIINNGPTTSSGTAVRFSIPEGTTLINATSAAGTCTSSATGVDCPIGTLTPGQSGDVTMRVRADSGAVTRGKAEPSLRVWDGVPDLAPGNDSATVTTAVVPAQNNNNPGGGGTTGGGTTGGGTTGGGTTGGGTTGGGTGGGTTQRSPSSNPGSNAPDVRLSVASSAARKRRILARRLLSITARSDKAGRTTFTLALTTGRKTVLGTARTTFTRSGSKRVTIRLTSAGRRALARTRGRVVLLLTATTTDSAGNRAVDRLRIRLR